jgi:hypothetical protein
MRYLTGLLIDEKGAKVVDIPHTLDSLHATIKCHNFDIATRLIGNKQFDIFVDDEGLLVHNPIINGFCIDADEVLAGNLLVLNSNEEGETLSLSTKDIEHILAFVMLGKLFYSVREIK